MTATGFGFERYYVCLAGLMTTLNAEQGKQFDLDASYDVIKEAVEEAGMECYRADELRIVGQSIR